MKLLSGRDAKIEDYSTSGRERSATFKETDNKEMRSAWRFVSYVSMIA